MLDLTGAEPYLNWRACVVLKVCKPFILECRKAESCPTKGLFHRTPNGRKEIFSSSCTGLADDVVNNSLSLSSMLPGHLSRGLPRSRSLLRFLLALGLLPLFLLVLLQHSELFL